MESLLEVPSPTRHNQILPQSVSLPASWIGSRGFSIAAFQPSESPARGGARPDCSVAGISHDVRNMLAALKLYCDLLSDPGVLSPSYRHYAEELHLVAQAGSSLLERLEQLVTPQPLDWINSPTPPTRQLLMPRVSPGHLAPGGAEHRGTAVANLATELEGCHKLLAALAGPSIRVELDCRSYTGPLPLHSEDLTRVLINLVGNASEAMPKGGEIRIAVALNAAAGEEAWQSVVISIEDDGPGIDASDLQHLFKIGYTTKRLVRKDTSSAMPDLHGMGLAIVRGLLESAGGTMRASSSAGKGARFEIIFPVAATNATTTKDVAVKDTGFQEGIRVEC